MSEKRKKSSKIKDKLKPAVAGPSVVATDDSTITALSGPNGDELGEGLDCK